MAALPGKILDCILSSVLSHLISNIVHTIHGIFTLTTVVYIASAILYCGVKITQADFLMTITGNDDDNLAEIGSPSITHTRLQETEVRLDVIEAESFA